MSKDLYIVNTNYHIYLTLLKANYDLHTFGKHSDLILTDHLVNPLPAEMVDSLKELHLFDHIYIMDDSKITKKTGRKFKKLFTYRNKILKYVAQEFRKVGLDPFDDAYEEIFVCLDYSAISHYFMIKKHSINLIEDGMDTYYTYHENWRIYLNYLFGFPRQFGLSKYIKSVWVLYPEKLPMVLKNKAKHYDLVKYKEQINDQFVQKMMDIYIPNNKKIIEKMYHEFKNKKIFLLLTQSYSEFGHMTEEKKIEIYKNVIRKYAKEDHFIVIKTHPKETTDYYKRFPDYMILPGSIPIEIISGLIPSIDVCVTINSTALFHINCNEKIMIEGEFNEEGWKRYMKQLNIVGK